MKAVRSHPTTVYTDLEKTAVDAAGVPSLVVGILECPWKAARQAGG